MSDQKSALQKGILNSAFVKNPILFEAVGLSPVLAMTTSLKSAIILSVASCIELMLIELFSCLLLKKVKRWIRMPIYALWGLILNLPIFAFFNYFTPNEAINAGIFLPLIAVNSLIALHCERYAVKHTFKQTFIDAVFASLGYVLVILLVGALREMIGNGTIYGVNLHFPIVLKGMLLPFGGFLMLGFLAAAVRAVLQKVMPEAHPERAFRMHEIQESHLDSFKSLVNTDFNPYAEEEDETDTPKKKKPKEKKEKVQKPKKEKKAKAQKGTAEIAKSEKQEKKKAKKKAKLAKKVKPEKPLTEEQLQKAKEHEKKRLEHDGYLLEFDEMLSDLDAYKKKQEKASETTKTDSALEEKGGEEE